MRESVKGPAGESASDPREMSFLGHLEELRGVLIRCIVALAVGSVICWFFSGRILNALVAATAEKAIFIGPAEPFGARVKVAVMCGILLSFPLVAYWIWGFVVPGLVERERRFVFPIVVSSTVLFYLGALFSFFALTPIVVRVLIGFGTELITPQIAIAPLLSLIIRLVIACGLVFQLPLVLTILSYFGVVSPRWLKERWRYAVVLILIMSAIATPADAASQLILAAPMLVLYFLSVYISGIVVAARWRRRSAGDDDPYGGGGSSGEDDPAPGEGAGGGEPRAELSSGEDGPASGEGAYKEG